MNNSYAGVSNIAFDNLPDELRQRINWCLWRYETLEGSPKPTKVPYHPSGKHASSTDPQTWCSFGEAVIAAQDWTKYNGIGFFFSKFDPYCGIDLDDPYEMLDDGTPKYSPDKQEEIRQRHIRILEAFPSYAETSPSGKGIHIIVRAKLDHGRRRDGVEMYPHSRYFTMTGNRCNQYGITECQDMAVKLWGELAPVASSVNIASEFYSPATESDDAIYTRAASAANGAKFLALCKGDGSVIEGSDKSGSAIDLALANCLAFHTKDPDQIERIILASPHGQSRRGKLLRRDGYLRKTIDKAFDWEIPPMDTSAITARANWEIAACESRTTETVITPVDLWAKFDPPALPTGLLPHLVEQFARIRGELMGADDAGLALSTLAVCAAAIPDHVLVQVKRNDRHWCESARLWVLLSGPPSAKKSPIIREAAAPLRKIDRALSKEYQEKLSAYEALENGLQKITPRPIRNRKVIEDITVEAAGEILRDNPHGILCFQDELSGWIGSLDKYSNGGGNKDRGFWLQSFNGGYQTVDRIRRGSIAIENVSVSLLGGIQPEKIRELAGKSFDDGLLQRFIPIILAAASVSKDEPIPDIASDYSRLIERLTYLPPVRLHFDDDAQSVRNQMEHRHRELQGLETFNAKVATHIGKYDGIFARLCVIWHCIENAWHPNSVPTIISGDTARRVAAFLHNFLLSHALSFYVGVLGLSDDHDVLTATAGYILTRPELKELTFRDVERGDSKMRALDRFAAQKILEKLEYLGWLNAIPGPRPSSPTRWQVNPEVHRLFAQRGERERSRREEAKRLIAETIGNRH